MRVLVPAPPTWPRTELAHGVALDVGEGVTLVVGAVEPLPANAQRWAELKVLDATAPDRLRVVRSVDRELAGGWPVAFVEVDALDHRGSVVERRVHALYQFVNHGCSIVARGPAAALDARRDHLVQLMVAAQIDFDDTVVALSQVWAGLDVRDRVQPAKLASSGPDAPLQKVDKVK